MSADVTIYTTDYCGYCVRAKQLLTKKGVAFTEIDVGDRPDLRAWLVEATRQRTVPQIFVNGRPVGGFTDLAELDRARALEPLLATAPSTSDPPVRR